MVAGHVFITMVVIRLGPNGSAEGTRALATLPIWIKRHSDPRALALTAVRMGHLRGPEPQHILPIWIKHLSDPWALPLLQCVSHQEGVMKMRSIRAPRTRWKGMVMWINVI